MTSSVVKIGEHPAVERLRLNAQIKRLEGINEALIEERDQLAVESRQSFGWGAMLGFAIGLMVSACVVAYLAGV